MSPIQGVCMVCLFISHLLSSPNEVTKISMSKALDRSIGIFRSVLDRPRHKRLSLEELRILSESMETVDPDLRRKKFPRALMMGLFDALTATPINDQTSPFFASLIHQATSDKCWPILNVAQYLGSHFTNSGCAVDDDLMVASLKAFGAATRLISPTIEDVELMLKQSINWLDTRLPVLSATQISLALCAIVTLRRSRNFTTSNHYRRRECNHLIPTELLARIRNQLLGWSVEQGRQYEDNVEFSTTVHDSTDIPTASGVAAAISAPAPPSNPMILQHTAHAMSASEASQLGWALASLGVWSPPLMAVTSSVIAKHWHTVPERHYTTYLWAITVAGDMSQLPFVRFCADKFSTPGPDPVDAIAVWCMDVLGVPFNPKPGVVIKPFPEIQDSTRIVKSSILHASVAKTIERIGIDVRNELEVGESAGTRARTKSSEALSVDIVIPVNGALKDWMRARNELLEESKVEAPTLLYSSPPQGWVVEVNGPNHYVGYCDGSKRLGGSSQAKKRNLNALGWEVLNLDVRDLNLCETGRHREGFIRGQLPAVLRDYAWEKKGEFMRSQILKEKESGSRASSTEDEAQRRRECRGRSIWRGVNFSEKFSGISESTDLAAYRSESKSMFAREREGLKKGMDRFKKRHKEFSGAKVSAGRDP